VVKAILMDKKDLIQARRATEKLLCKTIREFGISMVTLILFGMLSTVFFPSIMPNVVVLFALLFGVMFGIMLGAIRAYNIFWEKIDFKGDC